MKKILTMILAGILVAEFATTQVQAQTAGSAKMEVTILDYTGSSGASHYCVAWVTTEAGAFIKSLRKQGPSSWTSSQWGSHCSTWNTAKASSTVLDGYSSATATSYAGTNSPVILSWNCQDASNNLMPDGNYKFWVQYAEDSGQGPVTTSGLLWTKGTTAATKTYANQGANFANMRVTWSPVVTVAPTITSAAPTGTATVGVPYSFTCAASGAAPITFTAPGLPTGLSMSTAGAISGTPTAAGTFSGTITAANGTAPNATQPFSIVVDVVPARFGATALEGNSLIMSGTGPANGAYTVLTSPDLNSPVGAWTPAGNGTFNVSGQFRFTNAISAGEAQKFYKLKVP